MAMYISGRPDGELHVPWPPPARDAVRSPAEENTLFGAVSLAPLPATHGLNTCCDKAVSFAGLNSVGSHANGLQRG